MSDRTPDFENNLLRILQGKKPQRATSFELIVNGEFICRLAGHKQEQEGMLGDLRLKVEASLKAGYDIATCLASDLRLRPREREMDKTTSLNGNSLITDWESFEKYPWQDVENTDFSHLEKIVPYMPNGMKLCIMGPDGVLENVINIVGYDNLCFMLYEEPNLVQAIFANVGSRLLKYYKTALEADTVGCICSNDDWGFNSQTFLKPDDMRKYVFPWHKKIVEAAHKKGKPCILHSCGYYGDVIEDIINDMKFDARHSYEDKIIPVEEAYEQLQGRIAVLGGIDINFLANSTPEQVYTRCRNMLERTTDRGGYALGSGNSIPEYIPFENYKAMLQSVLDMNK